MKEKLPVLMIGSGEQPDDRNRIHELTGSCPECPEFDLFGPVCAETDIIDRLKEIAALRPPVIFIDVLTGGSARAVTLAAIKSSLPAAVRCHDGRHSLASASIAAGALEKAGHPYILLHGDPKETAAELVSAVKAGKAMRKLKDARIGQLGPLHFNILNSAVDPLVITTRFGSWIVPLSLSSMKKRMEAVPEDVIRETMDSLKGRCDARAGDSLLKKASAMRAALMGTVAEQRLDAVAADCWNEVFPSFGINPCLEFAFGEYIIACEGDLILALMLTAGKEITGMQGLCGDFYSLDETDGKAELMHCAACASLHGGSCRPSVTEADPPAAAGGSRKIAAVRPAIPQGPGIVLLLHGKDLDKLHLRECDILGSDAPEQMRVRIRIKGDASAFRREAAGNHYAVFTGNDMRAWELWAKWSGISIH